MASGRRVAGDSEENLRSMVGCFVEVYRKGLKVNAGKSKVMVFDINSLSRPSGLNIMSRISQN